MVSYKRKDETARKVFYGGHPPACTCWRCTERRLRHLHGYPKWFWIIAVLFPPVGSVVVGLVAGFRYRRWVAAVFMVLIGIAIALFIYSVCWEGSLLMLS